MSTTKGPAKKRRKDPGMATRTTTASTNQTKLVSPSLQHQHSLPAPSIMATHAHIPSADVEGDIDVNTSLVELAQASLAVPQHPSTVAIDPALMDDHEHEQQPEIQRDIIPSPGGAPEMSLYHPDVDDQSLAALAEATDGMQHVAGYDETLDQAQMRANKQDYDQQHDGMLAGIPLGQATSSRRRDPGLSAMGESILIYGPPPEIGFLPPPESPHPLRFQLDNEDQFQDWLKNQKELVKWRLVRDFDVAAKQEKDRERAREKRDKAREEKAKEQGIEYVPKPIRSYKRPQNPHMPIAERERNYQCPSHGNYNPVPTEKRKRYRAPTITCGCPANVKVSSYATGLLEVNWFWRHEGHVPGEKRTAESPVPPAKKRAPSKKKAVNVADAAATTSLGTTAGAQLSVSPPPSAIGKALKEEQAPGTLASLMAAEAGQGPSRHAYANRHDVPESAVRGS